MNAELMKWWVDNVPDPAIKELCAESAASGFQAQTEDNIRQWHHDSESMAWLRDHSRKIGQGPNDRACLRQEKGESSMRI